MEPLVLFGIQFTMSLAAYGLIAFRYLAPRPSPFRVFAYPLGVNWVIVAISSGV
jgi:hypothetical protein